MQIAAYNPKGGQGKTTTAMILAQTIPSILITNNDQENDIRELIGERRYAYIRPDAKYPELGKDYDVVYDFGGTDEERAFTVIDTCDLCIVPVRDTTQADMKSHRAAITALQTAVDTPIAIFSIYCDKEGREQLESLAEEMGVHYYRIGRSKYMREAKSTGLGLVQKMDSYNNPGSAAKFKRDHKALFDMKDLAESLAGE